MRSVRTVLSLVGLAAMMLSVVLIERRRTEVPEFSVMPSDSDSLPEQLEAGAEYEAVFRIDWTGPIDMTRSVVSIYASRRGDTSEDAPADRWPLVCITELDDVVSRARVVCPVEAPGAGEFALQLQVTAPDDELIAEAIYVHMVVPEGALDDADTSPVTAKG